MYSVFYKAHRIQKTCINKLDKPDRVYKTLNFCQTDATNFIMQFEIQTKESGI